MNESQALRQARRRWGQHATVRRSKGARWDADVVDPEGYVCRVGRVTMGMFFEVLAEGPNWDAAFEAYDQSDKRATARAFNKR